MANMIIWKNKREKHPTPLTWAIQNPAAVDTGHGLHFLHFLVLLYLQELSSLLGGENLCRKSSSSQSEFCWNYREWYCEEDNRLGICWWSKAYKGMLTYMYMCRNTSWTKCSILMKSVCYQREDRIPLKKKLYKINTINDPHRSNGSLSILAPLLSLNNVSFFKSPKWDAIYDPWTVLSERKGT